LSLSLITGSSVTLEDVNFFENLDINKECKDKNYNDNENDFYIFDDSDSYLSIHTKIDGTKIYEYDTIFDYITEIINGNSRFPTYKLAPILRNYYVGYIGLSQDHR